MDPEITKHVKEVNEATFEFQLIIRFGMHVTSYTRLEEDEGWKGNYGLHWSNYLFFATKLNLLLKKKRILLKIFMMNWRKVMIEDGVSKSMTNVAFKITKLVFFNDF